MSERKSGPRRVVLVSDGIRGHRHQSLGVARWLERLYGAEVSEVEVSRLAGFRRFLQLKLRARRLVGASPDGALRWLRSSSFGEIPAAGADTLFIAAGSSAAPFCLALAGVTGGRAAILMTPSVLGIQPFDFAIVPEHDHPRPAENLFITLGAPNHIDRSELQSEAERLFAPLGPFPEKVIALLLGGSDANYNLDESWARSVLPDLREAAESEGAALLVTSSRRTGAAVDSVVEEVLRGSPATRYLLLASRSPDNPIPAMLGAATHVLVTEDSVSMASEAVTAGFKIGLLRVGRQRGPLVKVRHALGGGTARFDALFDALADRGFLDDLGAEPDFTSFLAMPEGRTAGEPFNEAKRAAEWILNRWEDL